MEIIYCEMPAEALFSTLHYGAFFKIRASGTDKQWALSKPSI